MGRSMLIVVMGVIITLSMSQTSLFGTLSQIEEKTNNYAISTSVSNIAHTGAEIALQNLRNDSEWRVQGMNIETANGMISVSTNDMSGDTLMITATGSFQGQNHSVNYIVVENSATLPVPDFQGAMSIDTDNFVFSLGGSAEINGNDVSGTCEAEPGVAVTSETGANKVGTNSRIKGDPDGKAGVVESGSFAKAQELIKLLENSPHAKHITETNYKGDFGSKEEPGVFFIDQKVRLSGGIPEGYGIMIIRAGGELEMEGELELRGNFTFNGLVIFENAYNLDARGTPTINGSILIGSTSEVTVPIYITGNVQFNYDCTAREYARIASENAASGEKRFATISVFE
jgi:hypothetical protein